MKIPMTKDWIKNAAHRENGSDVQAGSLATDPSVCEVHCSGCEDMDHHWMQDCDDETGASIEVCKHCEATRCPCCHGSKFERFVGYNNSEEVVPCSACQTLT